MTCEAMRIEKIPSAREIRDFHDAMAEKEGYQLRMYAPQHQPHQGWRLGQLKALLEPMLPHCPKVLEVGCADGMFTPWLAERAQEVVAIDIVPVCIERCQALGLANVTFILGEVKAVKDTDFDLALACEVLEHCLDPEKEMARLREKAEIIVASVPITETPNEDAFNIDRYWHPQKPGDGSGHIFCFREDTFKALFEEIYQYETDGISAIIVGR